MRARIAAVSNRRNIMRGIVARYLNRSAVCAAARFSTAASDSGIVTGTVSMDRAATLGRGEKSLRREPRRQTLSLMTPVDDDRSSPFTVVVNWIAPLSALRK